MKYKKLSDVANFREERTANITFENYISTENMLKDKGGITMAKSLPNVKTASAYYPNDILLSNIRPYFRKIWYANRFGSCSNDVLVIRANETIDEKFLYYVLSDNNFFNYDSVTSKGTKMPRGTPKAIMKYFVPDIDNIKQKKIADILSAYDNLIENNNKRIKLLEQIAENLYKEWFVRFRFPGYENTEFENGVPKGWEYKMLSKITEVLQRGISPNYNDDGRYTVISQKCIRGNIMDINEARQQVKEYESFLNLENADTVICSTGTGTLGRVGKIIGEYPNTTYDSHVTLARAKKGLSKQFLYGAIKKLQPWFMNMGIGSTNQQELYITLIRKTSILVPTESLLKKYEDISKPIHDKLGVLISENEKLVKQRDMLLPRLMSGKMEV